MKAVLACIFLFLLNGASAQVRWQNVDSLYAPLPASLHIYYTQQAIDTAPFRAFYLEADLHDNTLKFTTDTTQNRRLTPQGFYEKNGSPIVVVNGTFFSLETGRNLNVVVKEGRLLSGNPYLKRQTGDTTQWVQAYRSAIGINKRRRADVAWIRTDSVTNRAYASQLPMTATGNFFRRDPLHSANRPLPAFDPFKKWKVETAIGGGPVLLQDGQIQLTNDIEGVFPGKAALDKHPRTAMGYTANRKLIILVVEGRNKNAGGASLPQLAQILKDLGCVEALNLDGGGSTCLLVNGKETIKPSDKEGQRPVPAVFLIHKKKGSD